MWQELTLLTRPVIVPSEGIQWSGSTHGYVEEPTMSEQIANNMQFVSSMIVLPLVIIGLVVVWDKRKWNSKLKR